MRTAILGLLVLPMAGCGYLFGDSGMFRDRSGDYRDAEELPLIQVPENREQNDLQEIYAIPVVTADRPLVASDDVPRPEPLLAASAEQMVRIQRLGQDTWVLVAIPPGQLWPQLRSFMSTANVPIGRVDARAGIIESGYVDLQDQERRARFRFRVDNGVQRGNSELHVLQMFESSEDAWPSNSEDPELESEMLRGVAQFIANSADTAPVSMMAEQSISSTGRVTVVEDNGDSYIRLDLPFERAWASLARTLESSGFEITDRNRSEGLYYATYSGAEDEEEDSGWFNWFGDDEEQHPLTGVPLLLSVEQTAEGPLAIRMREEGSSGNAPTEDLLSLLQLVKSNIN